MSTTSTTIQPYRTTEKESRKRRTHTKSRRGCGNCKLRRVKCDESKPCCKRCKSFGVSCSYGRDAALQSNEEVTFVMGTPQDAAISMNRTILGVLNESFKQRSPCERTFQLSSRDLETLERFRMRTAFTLGNTSTRDIFQRSGFRLALEHPFLMHATLTLTLIHDRADSPHPKPSARELYHWCEATSQFSRKLTDRLTPSERDALWIASALLGCCTMGQVVGDTPEDVWPLSSPSQIDLNWLKLGEGKKVAWKIADPYRPDSVLRPMVEQKADDFIINGVNPGVFAALPPELVELCNLVKDPSPWTNPYYVVGAVLGRVMPLEFSQETIMKFLGVVTLMPSEFRDLLDAKDYRAILLLAYYLAKLRGPSPWWSGRRLRLECESICRYLDRFYGHIPHMEKLLEFPRTLTADGDLMSTPSSDSTGSLSPSDYMGNDAAISFNIDF